MQADFIFQIGDFVKVKAPKETWGNDVGLIVERVYQECSMGVQLFYHVRLLNAVSSLVRFNESELRKYESRPLPPEPMKSRTFVQGGGY